VFTQLQRVTHDVPTLEEPMSLKYLLTTAAVSLGVVVAFEKFRGKAA
jgi:hypothetical protein